MTPKEKATELVERMKWDGEMSEEKCFNDFAKQCALIAVDEILGLYWNDVNGIVFWNEVKTEIQKL